MARTAADVGDGGGAALPDQFGEAGDQGPVQGSDAHAVGIPLGVGRGYRVVRGSGGVDEVRGLGGHGVGLYRGPRGGAGFFGTGPLLFTGGFRAGRGRAALRGPRRSR